MRESRTSGRPSTTCPTRRTSPALALALDRLRELVADDERDQDATGDAAAVLDVVLSARLWVEADVARCHRIVLWHRLVVGTLMPAGGDLDLPTATGGRATRPGLARSAVTPGPT